MPTNTLTSLAILKVNIDHGNDYLDYLRPFVLQVLFDYNIDPITDNAVSLCLQEQFGIAIPGRTIQIVLKRIARHHAIKREHKVYRKIGDLTDPMISQKQVVAERHIQAVLRGLKQYSQGSTNPIDTDERAIAAICAFLADFDVICLRAYLRGTVIPQLNHAHQSDIVHVSRYVHELQHTDPEKFDSFLVLVQGHMLANALLCPDLQNFSQTYKKVTFYLDAPLLLHALGLEGKVKEAAARELIALLIRLGGNVAAFSHSCQELIGILHAVAANMNSPDGYGLMVNEARKRGTTRSDLLLLVESLEDRLSEVNVKIENTPQYTEPFQIDERVFEQVLSDEVSYNNPRAIEYDTNSVRSIYAIRKNRFASSIERAGAVLVTSNSSFARVAWEFGQQHESSSDVSSVVTSFSLANMAWLKAPLGAPTIPRTQVLAIAYAALQPSTQLLNKYMSEIDRLEAQGKISERDHQLLRSSLKAHDELMRLTLGEDTALTEETITQTLERVSTNIKREASEKVTLEKEQHEKTRDELFLQKLRSETTLTNLFWICHSTSYFVAWIFSGSIATALVIGLLISPLIKFGWDSWITKICSGILIILTLVSLLFGSNVKQAHHWVQHQCLSWLLKKGAKALGIKSHEWDSASP